MIGELELSKDNFFLFQDVSVNIQINLPINNLEFKTNTFFFQTFPTTSLLKEQILIYFPLPYWYYQHLHHLTLFLLLFNIFLGIMV
jgi:hypothetical protein